MKFKGFITAAVTAATLWSAGAAEYPVYKIARAPEIDGKLDDYAWKRLPEARGFMLLDKANSYVTTRPTRFQMGYKDDILYLAVRCTEPDPKSIKAVETYRDGWTFDDAIEMFFLPKDASNYMQLLTNANGARWAKRQNAERETEPPTDWKAASGRTPDGWVLEMAIPLRLLGAKDVDGMKFNIARNIPGDPAGKHQCWAKVLRGFGDTARFAVLKKQNSNGPADPELESAEINKTYDQFLYLALLDIGRGGKRWKEVETRYSSAPGFDKVRELQQKIAKTYTALPKSEQEIVYNEWLKTVATVSRPRRFLELNLTQKGLSDLKFFVNGKAIAVADGRCRFSIAEGVTALALSAKAGADASLRIHSAEFPVLDKRWACSGNVSGDWTSPGFDDRSWKPMSATLPAGNVYLRQFVIWNQHHDGQFRCINPTVRVWNFSLDSVEPVYLSLYSPTGQKVDRYDFTFTLPDGFRLLDMEPGAKRNRLSLAPEKVKTEKVSNGTRYTLTYKADDIHEWKTADSILGIYKDGSGKPGNKGAIPYARLINNNGTEIGGALPYELLPKVNGRRLKTMLMSFYMGSMPQGLSPELTDAVVKGAIDAGADVFAVYPYKSKVPDSVLKNGGILMLGYLNHPIWGSKLRDGAVTQLFKDHPELFCLYYNGERKSDLNEKILAHQLQIQFCPSLITGKYKGEFTKAVQTDYKNFFFKDYPDAKYVFLNWEQEPWTGSVYTKSTNPTQAYCFCPLCKEAFRKWAKLPADADLSNESIFKNRYEQWRTFRYSQDAAMHAIVVKAIQDMGKTVFFYSWSNHFGYWEAAKDIPYYVFLGCPGNGTADRRQQIGMDEYMKFHKGKLGRRNMAGQRFVFFPQTYGWNTERKEGWLRFNVMSDDGYIQPKTWKWETIRILATLQGGYDLQNPLELVSGVKYYVGEATRMIAGYEKIFHDGVRNDKLAESKDIAYPDLLVLALGKERLVLLFNETDKPKTVTVRNLSLRGGEKARAYYADKTFPDAAEFTLTIPANDAEAVHIQ
ncbi:MAG: hypothetical protein BWY31_01077 [Lentisphaerae bacterium ADurb.Bin242]|nr:MAG: hypothetical protein BWY31_01077 [Lentisphaerae bacterium ADurb.Bin242]